ncbi:MAG: helix-turn-helix domain-containing protein [Desulfobulbus sp.]
MEAPTANHPEGSAISHSRLVLEEPIVIELFVHMGMSCRGIATHLGRHHTTVSGELRRNSSKNDYRFQTADRRAHKRRKQQTRYGQGRRIFPATLILCQRRPQRESGGGFRVWPTCFHGFCRP